MNIAITRHQVALRGRRLEYFTIAWNSLEGLVAVVAGALAGSISLVGFGIDSFIEVTSGGVLMWRMAVDDDEKLRERNEKLSLRIVGVCFMALAAYISYESISDLLTKKSSRIQHPRNCFCLRFSPGDARSLPRKEEGGRRTWQPRYEGRC